MNDTSTEQTIGSAPSDDDLDRRLVARFQAGEESAFDDIVAIHQGRVERLVYRVLGWPADVEDVVQEVFVAALSNLLGFRARSKFSTWLTTIALNKCRSHQRRRLLWFRNRARLVERQQQVVNKHEDQEPSDCYEQVRQAVRSLPLKYREPIVLRYFERMPVQEIADVLALSAGAVEVRLSRARRRLKDKLAPFFEGE